MLCDVADNRDGPATALWLNPLMGAGRGGLEDEDED